MAFNRFFVNENENGVFTVTDTTTSATQTINYNYVGNSSNAATTWDFAPLVEQKECDENGYLQFRNRMHGNDEQFIGRQMLWNRRLDVFHEQEIRYKNGTSVTGTFDWNTRTGSSLSTNTFTSSDTNGTFWLTSDVTTYSKGIPWIAKKYPRLARGYLNAKKKFKKLSKILNLNESGENRAHRLKEKNGMKLLKGWLDEKEFTQIMKRGELEIFAEDAVYIVKKNPMATVIKKDKNGNKESFCLIPKNMGYATGDILLAKILMLKTDPKNFEKQSNGMTIYG